MFSKINRFKKHKKNKRIAYINKTIFKSGPNFPEPKLKKLFYNFCDTTQLCGSLYLRKGKTSGIAKYNYFTP